MKNKKGFLLSEETLKIVIAVISISFLIYLLTALYFSMTGEQKSKEAEESMRDVLLKEVNRINLGGEFNIQGIYLPNPSGWYIFNFVGENKKPNLCTEQNCLCICEKVFVEILDRQIKQCDKKGSCIITPNLNSFEKIKIEKNGVWILVQKVNEYLEIKRK